MEQLVVTLPAGIDGWAAMTAAETDAKVADLNAVQRRVEAALVTAVDQVERSGHYRDDGHRSVASWLMATTNCTRSEATARHKSAKMPRSLEHVAAEFAAGRVGIAQVRELARLAANPRSGDQIDGSEDILLDAAQSLEYADFRVVTERWEQLADADGAHADHEAAHEFRDARCHQVGDEVRFETSHGTIQGASMRMVFEAFCQAEFDRDWAWVTDTYGDDANATLLPRTAAQRRADAYVAMVLSAAEAGTGSGASIDTTVNLVCDLDQFERYANEALTDEPVDIDPATVRDRRCETTSGQRVDPRQMVASAIHGRIRLIVTDGAAVIVHAGRKRRLFTGALRQAIQAIDPVCGWLGCNLRAQICDIDHLQPRSRGGPTNSTNGKVLCAKHNIFKHVAEYRIDRQPDGRLHIIRPDGTRLRPPDAA